MVGTVVLPDFLSLLLSGWVGWRFVGGWLLELFLRIDLHSSGMRLRLKAPFRLSFWVA
jgi:hypothetical protein